MFGKQSFSSLSKQRSYKPQNIKDFKGIRESSDRFFAFIHNGGTVENTAGIVDKVFRGFCEGESRDDRAIESCASVLYESVRDR